jgi:ubiquinone/menaquinone biosynthesis C-methylase UbiE
MGGSEQVRAETQTTKGIPIDLEATGVTRARYDRVAPVYDLYEGLMEGLFFRSWRRLVWRAVQGHLQQIAAHATGAAAVKPRLLEVGVGTGKNLPYYPEGVEAVAIDISEKMLERARRRAQRLKKPVELLPMDAQALAFPDESFDVVVATFVFCSVPDPVLGLREINRVLKPHGRVVLLEHMRPRSERLGKLFDLFNPLAVRLTGANINRRTVENVRKAGLAIESVKELSAQGIVKRIVARKGSADHGMEGGEEV